MKVRGTVFLFWPLLRSVRKWQGRKISWPGLQNSTELGAHIVKTYYCENFEKVVEGCPVPVIIAGGKKLPEEMEVFD